MVGPAEALAFAAALLLGASRIYCFWLILTTGAFWIVRMDQIAELFEGIYQSGRWPAIGTATLTPLSSGGGFLGHRPGGRADFRRCTRLCGRL